MGVQHFAKNIPILLYHSVSDTVMDKFRPWSVTPACFREQLRYVVDNGFTPLHVTDLVTRLIGASESMPAKPIVITFDDGLADFAVDAVPILQEFKVPATVYVTTACIGKTSVWLTHLGEGRRPMMSAKQIRDVAETGIECGAHSRKHPELDILPAKMASEEIGGSKRDLENTLGQPVVSFAYPHGYYSHQTRQIVKGAGFTSAAAVKHAMSHSNDDCFALSRINIYHQTDVRRFGRLLSGKDIKQATAREKLITQCWRWIRRIKWHCRRISAP